MRPQQRCEPDGNEHCSRSLGHLIIFHLVQGEVGLIGTWPGTTGSRQCGELNPDDIIKASERIGDLPESGTVLGRWRKTDQCAESASVALRAPGAGPES